MAVAAQAPLAAPCSAPSRARGWSRVGGIVLGGLVWAGCGASLAPGEAARDANDTRQAGALDAPAFDDPAPLASSNGVAQLTWSGPPADYEVQLEHGEHARTVYRGPLPSAHLSGLPEGDHAVRVRVHEDGAASPWSAAKVVQVRHHASALVWPLVGLGLLTFGGTVATVLRSSRGSA